MRRYIILFLITGIVWAQTEFDKLVLKDGTIYLGEYSKTEKEIAKYGCYLIIIFIGWRFYSDFPFIGISW